MAKADWQEAGSCFKLDIEPHAARRRAILKKYGKDVRQLYGTDLSTAVQALFVCLLQTFLVVWLCDKAWWKVLLAAYLIGGTCNKNLYLAIHEVNHGLVFQHRAYSTAFSILCNCPLAMPLATQFGKTHRLHHSNMNDEALDVDLPSSFETALFRGTMGKLLWMACFFPLNVLRVAMRPIQLDMSDFVNIAVVMSSNGLVLATLGRKALIFLASATIFGNGLHPVGAHSFTEHFSLSPNEDQETHSYYGFLNFLTYNVGFHKEHHDFPQIPHTRLHRLRAIAPEYYQQETSRSSWMLAVLNFLSNPAFSLQSRVWRLTPNSH